MLQKRKCYHNAVAMRSTLYWIAIIHCRLRIESQMEMQSTHFIYRDTIVSTKHFTIILYHQHNDTVAFISFSLALEQGHKIWAS